MSFRTVFSSIVNRGIVAGALGVMCLSLMATVASAELPQVKFENPQIGYPTGGMGSSVFVDGDTIIIGAPDTTHNELQEAGNALIYRADGLAGWILEAELTASDAAAHDAFGYSVALSGETAIVGACMDDDGGRQSGSAYIFKRSDGVWIQEAKITALDAAEGKSFAHSVSLSGDTALVGAPVDDGKGSDFGAAYVFTRSDGGWTQQQKLTASDTKSNEEFGKSVSLSGDTAIVGAHRADHGGLDRAGSAYVFTRSGEVWTQQSKLTASDADGDDRFGISVAISGETAIVGAYWDKHEGKGSGSAYIFKRSDGAWLQQAKLKASEISPGPTFGNSVAISGDIAVVGKVGQHSGSVDVFKRSGKNWTVYTVLTPWDFAVMDPFGTSVAVDGESVLVGAPANYTQQSHAGAAYFFTLPITPTLDSTSEN